MSIKRQKRNMRHRRVRAKIKGTSSCPRLSVCRSNQHMYTQAIDDDAGKTLVSAFDGEIKAKPSAGSEKNKKVFLAEKVGELIAEKLRQMGITQAVFDRGGFLYHGRVKALAEGARKGGLKF